MSNNSNYIQETENVQKTFKITQKEFEDNKFLNDSIQKPKYAIGFLYLITHKETGYMYSGSKLAYSLKDANTYYGSSLGKTISHICTKDKILQNGIDQYEFKLIMFCKSVEQLREFEDELNHFNIYFNGLKCLNGNGRCGGFRSRAGISPTQETKEKYKKRNLKEKNGMFGKNPYANKTLEELSIISKKKTETFQSLSNEEKEAIKQKRRDNWNNRTEEEKVAIAQKKRDTLNNKSKEEKVAIAQKKRDTLNNKSKEEKAAIKQKLSEKSSLKYYCPHDTSIQYHNHIKRYITKNYPQLKQWSQFTKEEKQSYLVSTPEASRLIAN